MCQLLGSQNFIYETSSTIGMLNPSLSIATLFGTPAAFYL